MQKQLLLSNKLKDININISYANDIAYPNLQYGYNHYIFKSILDNEPIIKKFKEKIYMITEPFYVIAQPVEGDEINFKSIIEQTNDFFKKKDSKYPNITDYSSCAIIEMIKEFNLIASKEAITTMHIIDDKESEFVKSIIGLRLGMNKSDNYIIVSESKIIKNDFDEIYSSKIKYNVIEPADLITTEINTIHPLAALTEQKTISIILKSLVQIFHSQKNNGTLILKLYETYTKPIIHMIEFLKTIYEEVFFVKPQTSYKVYYEKYLVCLKFKKNKITPKILQQFEHMHKSIEENKEFHIFNAFDNVKLDSEIIENYIHCNEIFDIIKFEGMNNIMSFLNLDNYNGYEYREMLNQQKISSEEWGLKYLS